MKKLLFFASAVALLASCSKDLTTESISTPAAAGKSTIYADFTLENPATRTHAEVGASGFKYIWDAADAIGVLTKSSVEDEYEGYFGPNAFFKYTANNEFEGDVELLDAEDYIAYYPYSPFGAYEEFVAMIINENQNYNFKGGEFGSFAQGAAPAIALGKTVDGKATFEFKALSSFVVLPIRGMGDKVKKVQLELGGDEIAGAYAMETEFEDTSFEEVFEKLDDLNDQDNYESVVSQVFYWEGYESTITLNCGTGVTLSPDKPTYFWFVVPAGADLTTDMTVRIFSEGGPEKGVEMVRSFDEEDGIPVKMNGEVIEATHRNYAHVLGPNATDDWFYNPTGSFLVKDEADFLMYAYAVTKGQDVVAEFETDMAACGMLYGENDDNAGDLRPAMIVSDLDFDNYYEKINELWDQVIGKYSGYKKTVLEAYILTKGVIPTIGGDKENSLAYSITGSVNGGNAAEIKGLQINGDGIFGGKHVEPGNTVSNLILTDLDVNGKYLVTNYADAPFSVNQSTPFAKFEKITVNGGTINGPFAEGEEAAVVNNAYTRNLDEVTVTAFPNEGTALYANTLRVSSNVEKPIASSVTFGKVIGVYSGKGKVVTVAEDGVEAFIEKIDVTATGANWFSVVTREEAAEDQIGAVNTSYWTGLVADKVNTDKIYTAEEYAFDVAKTSNPEITLTNNLDLRDKVRPEVMENSKVIINGEEKAIRNVVITEEVEENGTPTESYYYTMFGGNASAKDLTLENVTIKVVDGAKKAYVATLANTWYSRTVVSENVDVKGLTIIVPETATVSNEIGGLYRNVSLSGAAEYDLSGMLGSSVEFAADGEQYGENKFGYIAGRITLTATTADVSILGETEVETPIAKVYVNVTEVESGVHGTNLTFAGLTKDQVTEENLNLNVKVPGISNHTLWVFFGDDEKASYFLRASSEAAAE